MLYIIFEWIPNPAVAPGLLLTKLVFESRDLATSRDYVPVSRGVLVPSVPYLTVATLLSKDASCLGIEAGISVLQVRIAAQMVQRTSRYVGR